MDGLSKVAIRREIGVGSFFADSEDMMDFLNKKFSKNSNLAYHIKDICVKCLEVSRADARLYLYAPIKGSDSFQVMVFSPS